MGEFKKWKLIVGIILFAAWLALTFFPQKGDSTILSFIQMALGLLFGFGHADTGVLP